MQAKYNQKWSRENGVTLIELLIVMIIIAILSVVIFVSMTESIRDAQGEKELDLKSKMEITLTRWADSELCEDPNDFQRYMQCKATDTLDAVLGYANLTTTDILNFGKDEAEPIVREAGEFAISIVTECDTDEDGKLSQVELINCLQSSQLPDNVLQEAKELGQLYFSNDERNIDDVLPDQSAAEHIKMFNKELSEQLSSKGGDEQTKKQKKRLRKKIRNAKRSCR